MMLETDVRVILNSRWRRQQNNPAPRPQALLCFGNQSFPDASLLVFQIHGEVGEVAAITEIGDAASDTDEAILIPGRDEQVGIFQHPFNASAIIYWPPLSEHRATEKIDEFIHRYLLIDPICNLHPP